MSHPPPLLPGETSADLPANSNHTSKLNSPEAVWQQWEEAALGWLSSFPGLRDPSGKEMDLWIDSNISVIPKDLRALPRRVLHQRILSLRLTVLDPSQVSGSSQMEFPYRFQRTDQWLPVYTWLESLVTDTIVNSKEITDWLSSNTDFRDRLLARHSRYHLMHYIQKLHLKLLKKKGKLPKGMLLSAARASVKSTNGSVTSRDGKASYESLKDDGIFQSRRNDAYLRYELLTDLQKQLTSFLSKHNENNYSIKDCKQTLHNLKQDHASNHSSDLVIRNEGKRIFSNAASSSLDVALNSTCTPALDANMELSRNSMPCTATNTNRDAINSNPKSAADSNIVEKRKRDPIIATPAWSYSEALPAVTQTNSSSYSQSGEARQDSSSFSSSRNQNITMCLLGREQGNTWPLYHSFNGYAGRNQRRWIPLLEGWRSLECQFEGLAVSLKRRNYSNWVPTWCAYMSSVAIAQPYGRQGLQKVLDVRFHPDGLPQLVCSSNEVPNELLLYNLLTGRPIQLTGHNTQIQAVEFAVRGASIVSCGSNLLKVWDCTTGSCLFTLGSSANDQAIVGHTQKINAMTVNDWQSCLVVTGGGSGDGKLLLWNALRGELASDLNLKLRVDNHDLPSIDAMEFCNESLLACGSDFECGSSAVVQLWDIESAQSFQCFTANNSYITSLKVNPQCSTIITGSVDGTVGLFDIRTCNAVNYLSVGPSYEVTSVSFSSCGTYFSASSTSNYTLVWDTRLIPTFVQDMSLRNCFQTRDLHLLKPLHCLSHGKQMPTSENAGQLPGHVDVGDQGVNDARWLRNEPVLITASGDGSIAMWDVNLGKPCIRHLVSHTRCVNSVAVAPNDDYFCSGGDDQKVVLYHNTRGSARKWRLSHPLAKKS